MSNTESFLWKKLKRAIPEGDFCRHEDRFKSGIPDVSYGLNKVNGWIELKAYKSWPKNPNKPIPFRNFKQSQRRWLIRRGKTGGRCFVMVLIAGEVLLFRWQTVRTLGKLTRSQMYRRAVFSGAELDGRKVARLLS